MLKSRLPAVAEQRNFAANGGLLAHGTRPSARARRAAVYVDKILKGARPSDLPIELPTAFHIIITLKAAQELGIAVPKSVLDRATERIGNANGLCTPPRWPRPACPVAGPAAPWALACRPRPPVRPQPGRARCRATRLPASLEKFLAVSLLGTSHDLSVSHVQMPLTN